MSTVLLRVSARARDEARDLARYTGQTMTSAVEQAIHDAAVRAYYAKLAHAVEHTLADPDERALYERETDAWATASALPDEVWTEDDFLSFDDRPSAPPSAA
jgi:hypothetical protein